MRTPVAIIALLLVAGCLSNPAPPPTNINTAAAYCRGQAQTMAAEHQRAAFALCMADKGYAPSH